MLAEVAQPWRQQDERCPSPQVVHEPLALELRLGAEALDRPRELALAEATLLRFADVLGRARVAAVAVGEQWFQKRPLGDLPGRDVAVVHEDRPATRAQDPYDLREEALAVGQVVNDRLAVDEVDAAVGDRQVQRIDGRKRDALVMLGQVELFAQAIDPGGGKIGDHQQLRSLGEEPQLER